MNVNPNAIRECLQGDCNKILSETFHIFDEETITGQTLCDIDVDAVLALPSKKINYGRIEAPQTMTVMEQTSKVHNARGFVRGLFTK